MKWLLVAVAAPLLAVAAAGECRECSPLTPTPIPTPTLGVPWVVDCYDEPKQNGYLFGGYCVPGEETFEASRFKNPGAFSGAMTSYAEGVMERVASKRGYGLGGYRGGVALMGCGDIGAKVYIRRPGFDWDGPFLVVDCSARQGVYHNIMVKGLAVEVDYQTAKRYGSFTLPWVDVRVQGNQGGWPGMSLAGWYARNALSFAWSPWMQPATATATPSPSATAQPTSTATSTAIPQDIPRPEAKPEREAMTFPQMLFLLVAGHALADFALQGDRMNAMKKRKEAPRSWPYWLSAHALINGLVVATITGSPTLGFAEAAAHWLIDYDGYPWGRPWSIHADQWAHLLCKVAWAALVAWG